MTPPAQVGQSQRPGPPPIPRPHSIFQRCRNSPRTAAPPPPNPLYTAKQVQKGRPREGQVPERGVVEVKGVGEDAWLTKDLAWPCGSTSKGLAWNR